MRQSRRRLQSIKTRLVSSERERQDKKDKRRDATSEWGVSEGKERRMSELFHELEVTHITTNGRGSVLGAAYSWRKGLIVE